MRWWERHTALVFALALFAMSAANYFINRGQDRVVTSVGFGVVGLLILLIWVGTRGER